MPKERLHLLIADETLKALYASWGQHHFEEASRFAYLFGAISPDVLFYDLPFFHLSSLGDELHRLQGDAGVEFFSRWIRDEGDILPKDLQAWILGVTSHFVTDASWHPSINRFSDPPSEICRDMRLSAESCHHWLESEVEEYWMSRRGPPDGYLPLIKRFRKDTGTRRRYADYLRKTLARAGFTGIPSEAAIRRCLFWQTFLLGQFSYPWWRKRRGWLLARNATRDIGSLIVPLRCSLPLVPKNPLNIHHGVQLLYEPSFMAETVEHLAKRLLSLPVRF